MTTPYNPITAACKLDPRIARIISGQPIVGQPTAPGEDPVSQGNPPSPVGGSSAEIVHLEDVTPKEKP